MDEMVRGPSYDIDSSTRLDLHLEYDSKDDIAISVPIKTFIVLFATKFSQTGSSLWQRRTFRILFKKRTGDNILSLPLDFLNTFQGLQVIFDSEKNSEEFLLYPFVSVEQEKVFISGLCSVLRFLIKASRPDAAENEDIPLLGYQGGCLSAPAEVSTWTKFCEAEIPEALQDIIQSYQEINGKSVSVPVAFAKFESHMRQPIRMHNIRKRMQNEQKKDKKTNSEENKEQKTNLNKEKKSLNGTENSTQREGGDDPIKAYAMEQHLFAEGPDMLLSDVVLYANYVILCLHFPKLEKLISEKLPKSGTWMRRMEENGAEDCAGSILLTDRIHQSDIDDIVIPTVPDKSLYQRDPNRQNPNARAFTRQSDVDRVNKWFFQDCKGDNLLLDNIGRVNPEDGSDEANWDWDEIPHLAHPMGGNLPEKRLLKKCQQLRGMANAVLDIIKDRPTLKNPTLVDFCSGGGHLGILLAYLFRDESVAVCLVENKEESLRRAHARVKLLGLPNVWFYQCNLAYFQRRFDIGISLHACGVATDLVIDKCLVADADFVCCPCCYGSVRENHFLTYPKSEVYKKMKWNFEDYLIFGHTSDQTHDLANAKTSQGEMAMDVVDSDRAQHAIQAGYKVTLDKLKPHSCSPKNNVLIARKTRDLDR